MFVTVYVNDVLDLFEGDENQGLLLLVPVRLGSEALNPIYIPCVKVGEGEREREGEMEGKRGREREKGEREGEGVSLN